MIRLIVLLGLLFSTSHALARTVTEVRAAYLFKIASFIEFTSPKEQTVYCFINDIAGPGIVLEKRKNSVTTKKLNYQVTIIKDSDIYSNNNNCHFVYFTDEQLSLVDANQIDLNPHLLYVGESNTFLSQGGILSLIPEQGKVRIHVNRLELTNKNFTLSSQLLRLVRFYPR